MQISINNTPLIDIKPYIPEFDAQTQCRIGWLEKQKGGSTAGNGSTVGNSLKGKMSDERFGK